MPLTLAAGNSAGDFSILLDHLSALDIGSFVVDGVDLSPGRAVPSDGDRRIDHALQGFFFTCGPDHIRHPEPVEGADDGRTFPLHGSLCGTPARSVEVSAGGEPPGCLAETEVALANGGTALVSRRWMVSRDEPEVLLSDRLTNTGPAPFAPMLMYHMNIAGRLLGDETRISGTMFAGAPRPWNFGDGESAHFCLPAAATARDGWASVTLGPLASLGGRSLVVRFMTASLPFLQMWRCQRGGANVISIEPVSHRIARRGALIAAGEMPMLAPGKTVDYALAFQVR